MPEQKRMRPLLGTFVEIHAEGEAGLLESAVTRAFQAIEEVHALWSFHEPYSELTRLNQMPGQKMKVDPRSVRLLRLCRAMMRASEGRFNCTVGGALERSGALPVHGSLAELAAGSVDDIELGRDWARLRRPVRLTLDGVAKGYAVDLAIKALQDGGVRSACVNAGGDLRVFGTMARPIARRDMDGGFAMLGTLRNAAMASSGFTDTANASFPAQLIAPMHAPAFQGMCSVLAKQAWRADALTKVAGLAAPQERAALIERLGGKLIEAGTA